MRILELFLFAMGAAALVRAWLANRRTSLFHAIHWAAAAWLTWGMLFFEPLPAARIDAALGQRDAMAQIALCLTGCAGVAVLGARRPHVMAWNFVVLGLLAVMLLPMVEGAIIGTRSLDGLRSTFLVATLVIGIVNYLPTRFGPAAFLFGLGCTGELIAVLSSERLPIGADVDVLRLCLLAAPCAAMVINELGAARNRDELDSLWRDFRDRWGVVWGQRVREQFNRSAANAGWPVTLTWFGFALPRQLDDATRAAVRETLMALLKRFIEESTTQRRSGLRS